MTQSNLLLTLLPPPLSVDHAVLFAMGQMTFADPRLGTVGGAAARFGLENGESYRAIRMAMSSAISRLADPSLRNRITGALNGRRRLHADELKPSVAAVKHVTTHDDQAAKAISELAVTRVIARVSHVPEHHPVRTLSGRVLLVDVNLISLLSEIAEPSKADAPVPLKTLMFDNFGSPCVLYVDEAAVPAPRPGVPSERRTKPTLQLVPSSL